MLAAKLSAAIERGCRVVSYQWSIEALERAYHTTVGRTGNMYLYQQQQGGEDDCETGAEVRAEPGAEVGEGAGAGAGARTGSYAGREGKTGCKTTQTRETKAADVDGHSLSPSPIAPHIASQREAQQIAPGLFLGPHQVAQDSAAIAALGELPCNRHVLFPERDSIQPVVTFTHSLISLTSVSLTFV